MTFWKVSDTRMNCLITQAEIEALGYTVEDLTENRAKTEEFLNILVQKGQEVLGMSLGEEIQSFLGAFLPDRSLLLSISCAEAETDAFRKAKEAHDKEQQLMSGEEDGPLLTYQLMFPALDNVIQFCLVFGEGRAVQSRLYKEGGFYYLMLDFLNTEDGRKKACGIVSAGEFGGLADKDAVSELYLKEHERGIIDSHAIEKLCRMEEGAWDTGQ